MVVVKWNNNNNKIRRKYWSGSSPTCPTGVTADLVPPGTNPLVYSFRFSDKFSGFVPSCGSLMLKVKEGYLMPSIVPNLGSLVLNTIHNSA